MLDLAKVLGLLKIGNKISEGLLYKRMLTSMVLILTMTIVFSIISSVIIVALGVALYKAMLLEGLDELSAIGVSAVAGIVFLAIAGFTVYKLIKKQFKLVSILFKSEISVVSLLVTAVNSFITSVFTPSEPKQPQPAEEKKSNVQTFTKPSTPKQTQKL